MSGIIFKSKFKHFLIIFFSKRTYVKSRVGRLSSVDVCKIRNTGILSHIDAGKTTTTERMLYYSGTISQMGDVHCGNTITDFMVQEKSRGITIASAAVSFLWKKHLINLVDTPGHIDFTMEVEQSLNAMDSAVVVLDASAGVEAQTLTVWSQADKKRLPRIVYVNKCDRSDACLPSCIKSLKEAFGIYPLLLNFPIRRKNKLEGIVDIIGLQEILRLDKDTFSNRRMESDHQLYNEVISLRSSLIDVLSGFDDELAESVILKESFNNISDEELINAIRRLTIAQKIVPVLCGSSYKNVGVQTLMDAVVDFLPSPSDSEEHILYGKLDSLAARIFKVLHDKQRGPISFIKIYSGQLNKGQKVFNVNREKYETVGKLMMTCADDYEEISTASQGLLVAATGLKECLTGDIISSSSTTIKTLKKQIIEKKKLAGNEIENILNIETHIPEPVFFCSIEPPSQAYQLRLDKALEELRREDPSLNVSYNSNTGQTVLGGMGELHIEIVKDRLKTEYNIDAYLGPLQIAYKEQIISATKQTFTMKNLVGSREQSVSITLSLRPGSKKEILSVDYSKESGSNLSHLSAQYLSAIRRGILSALMHGPTLSSPVVDVHAMLHWLEVGRGTSETMIAAAASQCIQMVLKAGGTRLLEPIMSVIISCQDEYLNIVLSDISKRRSRITSIDSVKNKKEIKCEVPLAELLGYVKDLRTITSGTSTCSLTFLKFQQMFPDEEKKAIEASFGYQNN